MRLNTLKSLIFGIVAATSLSTLCSAQRIDVYKLALSSSNSKSNDYNVYDCTSNLGNLPFIQILVPRRHSHPFAPKLKLSNDSYTVLSTPFNLTEHARPKSNTSTIKISPENQIIVHTALKHNNAVGDIAIDFEQYLIAKLSKDDLFEGTIFTYPYTLFAGATTELEYWLMIATFKVQQNNQGRDEMVPSKGFAIKFDIQAIQQLYEAAETKFDHWKFKKDMAFVRANSPELDYCTIQ